MLAKQHRLTGVDVQFLLRKGKKIYGDHLVFVVFPQYQNRKYHQLSVQIPIKADKRATMRNVFKRTAVDVGREIIKEAQLKSFLKIFVFVNKQVVGPLQELIATAEKTTITKQRKQICRKDFISFVERLGKAGKME